MATKHTFTVTFRGDHVDTFQSVHGEGFLVLYYPDLSRGRFFGEPPRISRLPKRYGFYKTEVTAKREVREERYIGERFAIHLKPGVTEITDVEHTITATQGA